MIKPARVAGAEWRTRGGEERNHRHAACFGTDGQIAAATARERAPMARCTRRAERSTISRGGAAQLSSGDRDGA